MTNPDAAQDQARPDLELDTTIAGQVVHVTTPATHKVVLAVGITIGIAIGACGRQILQLIPGACGRITMEHFTYDPVNPTTTWTVTPPGPTGPTHP